MNLVKWDLGHSIGLVASTFLGGAIGYLEQQSTVTIVAALTSWSTAKPILISALAFGLVSLLAMAKQSFLVPGTPTKPSDGSQFIVNNPAWTPPPKRNEMRGTGWCRRMMAAVMALCLFATTGTTQLACTPSQVSNTVTWISQFLNTVTQFLQYAQFAWGIVLPLLPLASQPPADAEFTRAIQALNDAMIAVDKALAVAKAANDANPTVDLTSIKDAVAAVLDIVHKYSVPAGVRLGASLGSLDELAVTIRGWR
jgi:hypothetical protein